MTRRDVRELVAKLAAHVRPTCSELWNEAQAFLAAESGQTDEVEQRAWELLEAECGKPLPFNVPVSAALSAIKAALSQQPETQRVVDEGSRIVTSQLLHWCGIPVRVTGTVTTSPSNWPLIDAALMKSAMEL